MSDQFEKYRSYLLLLARLQLDKRWHAQTGASQGVLTRKLAHAGGLRSPLQFSADSKFAVIVNPAVNILIWNIESLEERVIDWVADDYFVEVAISPDGGTFATGGAIVRLRDLATGTERSSFRSTNDLITAMAFTPDARQLAVATNRGTIRLHDAESGEIHKTLHGHKSRVLEIAITADGGTLISRSADGTVKVWDLFDKVRPSLLRGHSAAVRSLAFAPTGELLSIDFAGMLKHWDVQGGTEIASRQLSIDGSPPETWTNAELSSDGQSVAIGTGAQVGYVLDYTTGNERFRFTATMGISKHLEFSHDGGLFATFEGSRVRVLETRSGQERVAIPMRPGFYCLAFLPDGKRLATADLHRECVWDIADGKPQKSISNPLGIGMPFAPTVLSCSPDGRILAAWAMTAGGPRGGIVKLWDLDSGKEIAALKGDQTGVNKLAFSPDSKTLVLSVMESPPRLKLWNVAVREEVATLHSHSTERQVSGFSAASTIAFSRDGLLLARGNSDGTIDLFWGDTDE